MEHWKKQKICSDLEYEEGSRAYISSDDPIVQYVIRWRLKEALRHLGKAAHGRLTARSNILVMCAGDGFEGSILCDMGYENVTVSDISDNGMEQAIKRDKRLKCLVLNAENADVNNNSFDVVIVQDGLHHLQSPVQGFTEMLRIAAVGALFLEPHDSLVGNTIGTQWEKNGDAINYVFRWTKKLVQDVACSYLGQDSFQNLSFSFWHHNIVYDRLGKFLGNGVFGLYAIRITKFILDFSFARMGNQFCGLILKN